MGYNNRQYQKTFLGNPSQADALTGINGGTAQIFSGAGIFHGVIVGTTTGTVFVVSDSISQTGVAVNNGSTAMVLKASIAEGNYTNIDLSIANGLYVTFGGKGTYTVLWEK